MKLRKTREERERELLGMMPTVQGANHILDLWKQAKELPQNSSPPVGKTAREMIEDIVAFEYQNG
jgi:hypothetical protein